MMTTSVWMYRTTTIEGIDPSEIIGFGVEAIDGSIGKIDEATASAGTGYIIVDTGPWIFGKNVMLPAGVISDIDMTEEKVHVNRSKDEIKNAPEYDESLTQDEGFHSRLGSYYGLGGAGYREWDLDHAQ